MMEDSNVTSDVIVNATVDVTIDERFREQMFERVPKEVQKKLAKSRIGIAGLGGLGSNIACMLARTGVPEILLIDFDRVEASNLNRQQYTLDQIGMLKTEALKENLLKINPWLTIQTVNQKITEENSGGLFKDCDIVCEAFDRAEAKAALINGIFMETSGIKIVSASGMAGYGDSNEIQTKRKLSRLYVCGDEKSDYQQVEGMMAPRVQMCAAHQANMVIRLLMGAE